jgi:hypothetical protein
MVMFTMLYLYMRQDDGKIVVDFIKKRLLCCLFKKMKVAAEDDLDGDGVHDGEAAEAKKRARRAHKKSEVSYADEQKAKMWFRPEKFKIMLAFVQIYSQMKSNYGVRWPAIAASYMRGLQGFNIDIVKLAAVDCIYRTDFYFSVTTVCAFPIGV